VALQITVPLINFDGDALKESSRAAWLQKDQAVAGLEEQRERVALEVGQALIALRRAEQRIKTMPSRTQAFEALQRAKQTLLAGDAARAQSTLAQISNARAFYRFADTAAIDACTDYTLALYRLRRAVGTRDGSAQR
jgi:outer membrane protein TolC